MTAKHKILAVMVVALMLVGVGHADQVLTFEGFADQTVITTQYAGINFNGATVLTCGGSLNCGFFPPSSMPNVVYNPSGPMSLDFDSAIGYFQGRFTYNAGLTVQAYDAFNNLLGSSSGACFANYVGAGCGSPNELVGVTVAGIRRIVITGGDGNNFTLDDAQFTGSVNNVPEPTSMALLASGMVGMGIRRFRNRA